MFNEFWVFYSVFEFLFSFWVFTQFLSKTRFLTYGQFCVSLISRQIIIPSVWVKLFNLVILIRHHNRALNIEGHWTEISLWFTNSGSYCSKPSPTVGHGLSLDEMENFRTQYFNNLGLKDLALQGEVVDVSKLKQLVVNGSNRTVDKSNRIALWELLLGAYILKITHCVMNSQQIQICFSFNTPCTRCGAPL